MRALPVALLAALSTPAFAASPGYEKCVAGIDAAGFTNSQRLDCGTKDMDRADAALNAAYRDTMARLPSSRQAALRHEERGWIDQRRSRCAVEKQEANPSRDVNRMLCLVRETDARTKALEAMR